MLRRRAMDRIAAVIAARRSRRAVRRSPSPTHEYQRLEEAGEEAAAALRKWTPQEPLRRPTRHVIYPQPSPVPKVQEPDQGYVPLRERARTTPAKCGGGGAAGADGKRARQPPPLELVTIAAHMDRGSPALRVKLPVSARGWLPSHVGPRRGAGGQGGGRERARELPGLGPARAAGLGACGRDAAAVCRGARPAAPLARQRRHGPPHSRAPSPPRAATAAWAFREAAGRASSTPSRHDRPRRICRPPTPPRHSLIPLSSNRRARAPPPGRRRLYCSPAPARRHPRTHRADRPRPSRRRRRRRMRVRARTDGYLVCTVICVWTAAHACACEPNHRGQTSAVR